MAVTMAAIFGPVRRTRASSTIAMILLPRIKSNPPATRPETADLRDYPYLPSVDAKLLVLPDTLDDLGDASLPRILAFGLLHQPDIVFTEGWRKRRKLSWAFGTAAGVFLDKERFGDLGHANRFF
jgi:hypothetical protein